MTRVTSLDTGGKVEVVVHGLLEAGIMRSVIAASSAVAPVFSKIHYQLLVDAAGRHSWGV